MKSLNKIIKKCVKLFILIIIVQMVVSIMSFEPYSKPERFTPIEKTYVGTGGGLSY